MASVKGGSYRTIEEICRVCLDTKSEKIPLSSCIIIDGKAVTISALLLLFTRLEELDSRLPPNLCISCVQHLENAQAFNRQCLKNNKFLLAQVNAEKKGGKRKKEDENGDSLTRINQIVKDWSTNKFPRILPKPSPAPPNAPSEAATPNTAVAAAVPRPSTVPLMATVPMAASVPAGGTAPPPAYVIVAPNENMKFVSCPHCAKCFVSANCLKTHIVQEHPFAFACTDCDKKFANSKELESHRGIHKKVKVVKVVQVQPRLEEKKVQPKPSRAGIDSSLVNLDLDVYHKEEALVLKSSQPPQPAVCCFCNRAYMSRDGLVQHFDRHSKSHHKFECVLCNRLFATRVVLNMHYIRVHQMSARVFFCGYCVEAKEAFVEDEAVAAHLLQHVSKSGENRAICTEEVDSEGDDGENRADSERNATICLEEAEYITSDLIIEGIKKLTGGALEDSFLVEGVAFKKTFSYAGFEMQPKNYKDCKIALLNIELELKAERDNAEVRVDNVAEYQKVVDAEWQILYDKLAALHACGANVVLSKLPIGDVATQYFADRDMFCAGRVPDEDMRRTQRACGGAVLTSTRDITPDALGSCAAFEERQIGGERFNIFTGCPGAKTCTLILRGGAEQFLEETERSLHDAIMIVRRTIKNDAVVAGGGAIEMELSRILRDHARSIAGKEQLIIAAIARALEVIPRQLADNAGLDATNILNKLRQKHHQGEKWFGVDIANEDVGDNMVACVWEPSLIKLNALTAACEAVSQILSIDETIKNVKSGDGQPPQMGRGMGRPMMG